MAAHPIQIIDVNILVMFASKVRCKIATWSYFLIFDASFLCCNNLFVYFAYNCTKGNEMLMTPAF